MSGVGSGKFGAGSITKATWCWYVLWVADAVDGAGEGDFGLGAAAREFTHVAQASVLG